MFDIAIESARHEHLKARLLAEHQDIDEETLADTLEGLTDLNEVITAGLRSALEDEAKANALKERLEAMRARLTRLRDRAKAKRQACATAMQNCRLPRLEADEFTVSLRPPSQRLTVDDPDAIPGQFWRRPDPVIRAKELTDALKDGWDVAGARLVQGEPSISVRVK